MTYLISFDIPFPQITPAIVCPQQFFSVFTAEKGKSIRSVTVYMSVEQSMPLAKNSDGFWTTNLGAGSILALLAKFLG